MCYFHHFALICCIYINKGIYIYHTCVVYIHITDFKVVFSIGAVSQETQNQFSVETIIILETIRRGPFKSCASASKNHQGKPGPPKNNQGPSKTGWALVSGFLDPPRPLCLDKGISLRQSDHLSHHQGTEREGPGRGLGHQALH